MSGVFDGKVALITGGAGGIGRGVARILAERGATIALADLSFDGAKRTAAELNGASCKAEAFKVDVTKRSSVTGMVNLVVSTFGQIDFLATCAGVYASPSYELAGYSEADWDSTFVVNVKGTVLSLEIVAQHMIRRRRGRVVTFSSHGGRVGGPRPFHVDEPYYGAYGASKAAVIHLTQTYAGRLASYNINVNCVCAGSVFTPLWENFARKIARSDNAYGGLEPAEVYEKWIRRHCPLGRPQTPEDVGKAVSFLVSDDAMNITGATLNVNGGQRMD